MSTRENLILTTKKSWRDFARPVLTPYHAGHKCRKICLRKIYSLTSAEVFKFSIQADGFVLAFREATTTLDQTTAKNIVRLSSTVETLIL